MDLKLKSDLVIQRNSIFSRLSTLNLPNDKDDEMEIHEFTDMLLSLHLILSKLENTGLIEDGLVSFKERSLLIFCLESMLFILYQLGEELADSKEIFFRLRKRLGILLSPNRPRPSASLFRCKISVEEMISLFSKLFLTLLIDYHSFISFLLIEYYLIDILYILLITEISTELTKIPRLNKIPQRLLFKSLLSLLGIIKKEDLKKKLSIHLTKLLISNTNSIGEFLNAAGAFDSAQPMEITLQMVKVACVPPSAFDGDYFEFISHSIVNIINSSSDPKNPSLLSTFLEKILVCFILALDSQNIPKVVAALEGKCPSALAILSNALSGQISMDLNAEKLQECHNLIKINHENKTQ